MSPKVHSIKRWNTHTHKKKKKEEEEERKEKKRSPLGWKPKGQSRQKLGPKKRREKGKILANWKLEDVI